LGDLPFFLFPFLFFAFFPFLVLFEENHCVSPHEIDYELYLALVWFKHYYSSNDVEKRHTAR
jgi:hypothetical protein